MNVSGRTQLQGSMRRWGCSWVKFTAKYGPLALVLVPLLAACGKPPNLINRYMLNYPPPVTARLTPLEAALQVELFSVAESLNRPEMVYKVNPYKTGVYQYNRWRTEPGYLATDYLTRDLRDSRLFKAVFGYERGGKARFRLEGGVVDFQENDTPEPWHAALTLSLTLLDTEQENVADKVMFQRTYQAQEIMAARTPQGLAEAMSAAMGQVSRKIIADVYQAVKERLRESGGEPGEYGGNKGGPPRVAASEG